MKERKYTSSVIFLLDWHCSCSDIQSRVTWIPWVHLVSFFSFSFCCFSVYFLCDFLYLLMMRLNLQFTCMVQCIWSAFGRLIHQESDAKKAFQFIQQFQCNVNSLHLNAVKYSTILYVDIHLQFQSLQYIYPFMSTFRISH